MRRSKILFWAIALLILLLGTFLLAGYYDQQTRVSQEASQEAKALVAEVRRLQLMTSLFRTDARTPAENFYEWDAARVAFMEHFAKVQGILPSEGQAQERSMRLAATLAQAEALRVEFISDFKVLEASSLSNVVGRIGLIASYDRTLRDDSSGGGSIALLGLTLFRLDEYQNYIHLVENDLEYLQGMLARVAVERHRNMRIAILCAFVAAFAGASIMLRRMIVLHSELERDHEAKDLAEAGLRASEADLRSLLDSIADAVISTDKNGCITRMNPIACKLTGWGVEEARGEAMGRIFQAVNELTGAPIPNPADRVLETGLSIAWDGNSRLTSKDGDERMVSIGAAPIHDQNGGTSGVVVVFRDITEQSRTEAQIRLDQKSDSVGKLASGVAHEINNVLQIVRANLAFAQDPRTTSSEAVECLTQIDTATRRAADLTRKLLIFSRKHPMRLAEGNIVRLFDVLAPSLRSILGNKIKFDILAPEGVPIVRYDQRLMEMALSQLCENAREAMVEGGTLCIEVNVIHFSQDEVDAYPWAKAGSFVQITVSDTGFGMDDATLNRIFDPFFTTKSLAVSTGLGLSVVQGIIHQHEGFIHVFSEIGRGTTFRIFLPTAHSIPRPSEVRKTTGAVAMKGKMILIADDDAPLRGMLAAMLRRNGYEVRIAGDGEDACSLAADTRTRFDLAILDLVMPRMGGVEAAKRIRLRNPKLPVILCTGHGRGPFAGQGELDATWHLLRKPLSPESVLAMVNEVLAAQSVK